MKEPSREPEIVEDPLPYQQIVLRMVVNRKLQNRSYRARGSFRTGSTKKAPRPMGRGAFTVMMRKNAIRYLGYLIAACAAARRAIGTRNGEQET